MRLCLKCSHLWSGGLLTCPQCSYAPSYGGENNVFPIFSEEFENEGKQFFDKTAYQRLFESEDKSFWFQARNKLVVALIKKYFPKVNSLFEMGCGTGFVLANIKKHFPAMQVSGADIYAESLSFAKQRLGDKAELYQMDGRQIPFFEEFDLICAFDVLEHIQEDEVVLLQMHKALKPGGGVVLAVPQHPSLWSETDEMACHVRRYKTNELQDKVKRAGFELLFSSSFVSMLMPLMWSVRRARKTSATTQLAPPLFLNKLLYLVLRIEVALLRMGIRLPFGGSRIIVARKVSF